MKFHFDTIRAQYQTIRCVQVGRLHVNVSRSRGLYGLEDTVSYSITWWWLA